MSSDKSPAGEGIIGGIISLFWNKKATPSASSSTNAASSDASKGQDYVSWSDSVIKKSSELVTMLEDPATASPKLVTQMGELDTLLQTDHESSAVRQELIYIIASQSVSGGMTLVQESPIFEHPASHDTVFALFWPYLILHRHLMF
jgi:hypothetical protein